MIVVSMPYTDTNSAVMVTAMIADADTDSSYSNGDSRSVRGRHRHGQSEAESCERSERKYNFPHNNFLCFGGHAHWRSTATRAGVMRSCKLGEAPEFLSRSSDLHSFFSIASHLFCSCERTARITCTHESRREAKVSRSGNGRLEKSKPRARVGSAQAWNALSSHRLDRRSGDPALRRNEVDARKDVGPPHSVGISRSRDFVFEKPLQHIRFIVGRLASRRRVLQA
jgi:hypothetical protein